MKIHKGILAGGYSPVFTSQTLCNLSTISCPFPVCIPAPTCLLEASFTPQCSLLSPKRYPSVYPMCYSHF